MKVPEKPQAIVKLELIVETALDMFQMGKLEAPAVEYLLERYEKIKGVRPEQYWGVYHAIVYARRTEK